MPRSSMFRAVALSAVVGLACGCGTTSSGASKASRPDAEAAAAASASASRVAAFECPPGSLGAGMKHSRSHPDEKLQVVTTVAPITSIVENVAGDRARVTGIIPEGEDSHTFEPKPSAAAVLSRADVVFVNGLKLEDPTKEMAAANLRTGAQIVELGTLSISPDANRCGAMEP